MILSRPCRQCGKSIELKIARDQTRKWFCGRSCSTTFHGLRRDMRPMLAKANTPRANAKKGRPGDKNGRWITVGVERQIHDGGYVEVKLPHGWEYKHRVVMNAPPDLVVHHSDGNPQNNDPANLRLMTRGEHSRWHGQSKTDFGRRWSIQHDCCLECSTVEREHEGHGYCTACYQRRKKYGPAVIRSPA